MKVKIEDNTQKAIDAVERSLTTAITGACVIVQGTAILDAPVDTGNLRGSLTFDVSGDEGRVGTNVDYAPHLEYGTSRMSAQPFLRPALDRNKAKIEKYISQIIGGALK